MKYRYLKNESWEDISYDLNVSYRTVHRIHASALNNFVQSEEGWHTLSQQGISICVIMIVSKVYDKAEP